MMGHRPGGGVALGWCEEDYGPGQAVIRKRCKRQAYMREWYRKNKVSVQAFCDTCGCLYNVSVQSVKRAEREGRGHKCMRCVYRENGERMRAMNVWRKERRKAREDYLGELVEVEVIIVSGVGEALGGSREGLAPPSRTK